MVRALSISFWACLVGFLVTSEAPRECYGQASPVDRTDSATETVRHIFAEIPNIPWYNSETDSLQQVDIPSSRELPSPGNWEQTTHSPKSRQNGNWNWSLDKLWEFLQLMVWLLLAALAVIAIWLFLRAYLRGELSEAAASRKQEASSARVTDFERLGNLPFDVKSESTDLLGAARRCYSEGKYGEAIVFLFSYQLLQMDQRQLLHLVRGKTNRQYLRELSARQELKRLVSDTMLAFEDFFFGEHPVAAERFEACWTKVDRFHELIDVEAAK